jgi:hypothetical protein
MNKPPSRAARAESLLCKREGQLIRGVKITWDSKQGGGNPLENEFGNPFMNNRITFLDNETNLKAGVGKKD